MFLGFLVDRATSWIEGILAEANSQNPRITYNQGLELVHRWDSVVLRAEIAALTKLCTNIREMYSNVVNLYFKLYFHQYPGLNYTVQVPSLSSFVWTFYKTLSQQHAIRSGAVNNMYGEARDRVFEKAMRETLYTVCRDTIDQIFSIIATQSQTPLSKSIARQQQRGPQSSAPGAVQQNGHNELFKSVVETCLQDVQTPAAVAIGDEGSSSRSRHPKTPGTARSKSVAPPSSAASSRHHSRRTAGTSEEAAAVINDPEQPPASHRTVVIASSAAPYSAKPKHKKGDESDEYSTYSDYSDAEDGSSYSEYSSSDDDDDSDNDSDSSSSSSTEEMTEERHRRGRSDRRHHISSSSNRKNLSSREDQHRSARGGSRHHSSRDDKHHRSSSSGNGSSSSHNKRSTGDRGSSRRRRH